MTVRTERIEYDAGGMSAVGHLALPEGDGQRPGVLVCREGPGIDDNAKARTERLASELGYVAFALDYIGGGERLPDLQATMERLGSLRSDPDAISRLGQAGLDVLTSQQRCDRSRLGAIGFCFGGTMALELARSGADLAVVVGFHSGLSTARPADAGSIKGKVLVCIGAEDPLIPVEQRRAFEDEMRAAGADWGMNLYGGAVHSFTNPAAGQLGNPGIAYDERADRRSWTAMRQLFEEGLG